MKIKRIITALVAVLLMFTLTVSSFAAFKDVSENHWAHDYIEWAEVNSLMAGTSATRFSPEGSASRAMLVTVFWRMANSPDCGTYTPFKDVKQDWYRKAVAWAYRNNIVSGTTPRAFEPNANVTREQAASMFYRFAKYRGISTYQYTKPTAFKDYKSISDWAMTACGWTVATGLFSGVSKSGKLYFQPKAKTTRAQLALLLQKFQNFGFSASRFLNTFSKYYTDAYTPAYFVNIVSASGRRITFNVCYVGRNASPIYETNDITATLNDVGACTFSWEDSWSNRGTGTLMLSNGIYGGVYIDMKQTYTAPGNRATLKTNGARFLTIEYN